MQARIREWAVQLRRVAPLGAVLLTTLVLDVGVAPHLAVRGAAADVVLVALVAVSVSRGSRTGAGFGFAAGLGADVFLATPLGTSALAYTLVGHVLGRSSRPRTSGSAAALCNPASTCFACRAGRRHDPVPLSDVAGRRHEPMASSDVAGRRDDRPLTDSLRLRGVGQTTAVLRRPSRVRRRNVARRAALQRSVVLTAFGVGVGRLGTAVVATALGGVAFPGTPGLLHIAGVAAISAPLGPLAGAAVRRLGRGGPG